MRKLLDIDNIINEVLKANQNNKLMIQIESNLLINTITRVTIKDYQYVLNRTDDYTVTIKREKYDSDGTLITTDVWVTNNLIVCVKNVDGVVVYPIIKTKNEMIELTFNDKISSNYEVYIV